MKQHISPFLFDPFFDLFYFWDFPRHLYHPIDNQSGCNQHTVIRDRFDVLDLDHLSLNTQFFNCLLGSLRKLIAFGSTHAENFNLFHFYTSH
jgi:hypothetical protein